MNSAKRKRRNPFLRTFKFWSFWYLGCIWLAQFGTHSAHAEDTDRPPHESTDIFSYYCQKQNDYYPRIQVCPDGWIAVPAPAPPSQWRLIPVYRSAFIEPDTGATLEQIQAHPTTLSLELFGRALIYSLNLDRAITDQITLGVGAAYWDSSIGWENYHSTDWVIPFYGNYYFTQKSHRGYLTLGLDWIHVSAPGLDNSTFLNNGAAGTIGGGYEYRNVSGLVLRIHGVFILGRTLDVSPGISLGLAF